MPIKVKNHAPHKKPKLSFNFKKIILLLLSIFVPVVIYFSFFAPGNWQSTGKISLAIFMENGDVNVATFDASAGTISVLTIPQNTLVEVSHSLGKWKVGSIPELAKNENLGGELITQTLTRSLNIPTELWAQSQAAGLTSPSLFRAISSVFTPYKSNLTLRDKLELAIFSMSVSTSGRFNLNLADTNSLKMTNLLDGSQGYVSQENLPRIVLSQFSDPLVAKEDKKIKIVSVNKFLAEQVGEIINVIGAKVVLIEKEDTLKGDCFVVVTQKSSTAQKISKVLNCSLLVDRKLESFDIVVKLGPDFAARF